MSRFVMIDDTNPSIQYSGPWFEVTNNPVPQSGNGPPFNNTLHGVNVNASFSFRSAVIVYGTFIANANATGKLDPTWECFIDNTNISLSKSLVLVLDGLDVNYDSENNWMLCGGGPSQFQDGPHILTVNATSVSNQTFWFDQIQYVPSASVSLNQSLLRIDANDSAIQYSPESSWQFVDNPNPIIFGLSVNFSSTQSYGAFLIYKFSGTFISLFGTTNPGPMTNNTYTIDNQEPISFSVGNSSQSNSFSNQMLFEIGQLSSGQHQLVVTYLGNIDSDTAPHPIVVNYFVQQDGSSSTFLNTPAPLNASASASVPSRSTPTSISVPSGSSSPGTPTDGIIGGVIAGLVLVSLLIALYYRRNNRRSKAPNEMSYSVPSPDAVDPFTLSPLDLNPTSTFLPLNYTSNGQSLPSQSIPSKFSHRNQPSDPTSTSSSGGIPPLTPLRLQFSSPAFISPSSEPPRLPLTGSQTNLDGARPTRVPETPTEPLIQQRPPSPQLDGATTTAIFVRHEDSGVRIPSAEDNVVELPPLYTPG